MERDVERYIKEFCDTTEKSQVVRVKDWRGNPCFRVVFENDLFYSFYALITDGGVEAVDFPTICDGAMDGEFWDIDKNNDNYFKSLWENMIEPQANSVDKAIKKFVAYLNGGHGSGNWGHSGRPGLVGGSAKGTGGAIAGRNMYGLVRYLERVKKPLTTKKMEAIFGERVKPEDYNPETQMTVNPNYSKGSEYQANCQLVVPTLEASLRGFKVQAKERKETFENDNYSAFLAYGGDSTKVFCQDFWDGEDGQPAKSYADQAIFRVRKGIRATPPPWTKKELARLEAHIKSYPEGSRIQVSFSYSKKRFGHTAMLMRVSKEENINGYYILDSQPTPPKMLSPTGYWADKEYVKMMRVDNKPFNGALVNGIMEKKK